MVLRWIPLLPAALMALADPLRRWRLSAALFGVGLVATSAAVLGRLPALSHALPSTLDAAVGLLVALGCALASGWCGVRLAGVFARAAAEDPLPLGLEPAAAKS
jgi:hypothetical protein